MKGKDIDKFQENLLRLQEERLNTTNTEGGSLSGRNTEQKGQRKNRHRKINRRISGSSEGSLRQVVQKTMDHKENNNQ